jgi:hypothetical protein
VIAAVDDWDLRKVFVPQHPASGQIGLMAGETERRKSIINSTYLLLKKRDAAGAAV